MKTRADRIEELMNQALQFGPEGRASFLAEACGQDSDLRQSVEAFLDAHDQAVVSFRINRDPRMKYPKRSAPS